MTRSANQVIPSEPRDSQVAQQLRITVLSGGPSAEREVSLKSGAAIARALERLGHQVHIADISPDDLSALDGEFDLIFVALHGTFGEDGQLQQILEQRKLCYCGSGAEASALAMDKSLAKARFDRAGIPTAPYEVVDPGQEEAVLQRWVAPAVVKAVAEGSSVGCYIVTEQEQLGETLRSAVANHGRCMIERFVSGYELTVGVLGEEALPPIWIKPARGFYDYQAKYVDDATEYIFDIDLPDALLSAIRAMSVRAHASLGCRDFSRVDWIVEAETQEPYVLEVNTIPGFTDHSLLPKAAQQAGYGFDQLCQRIVELTWQRRARH